MITHADILSAGSHLTRKRTEWQAALKNARAAFEELRRAEHAYIAAISLGAGSDRTRPMPKNANPYSAAA